MAESMQLPATLYKLIIRFSNGEKVHYVTTEPVATHTLSGDTRYALVTSCPPQNPAECAEANLINLRDVAFIKSERIALEDLVAERRTVGLNARFSGEENQPKLISQVKFI